MSAEFKNGLFGCFNDFRLCCLTFCVPCYTMGKNAEHFGEDCMIHGLLYCFGLNFGPVIRWRLRQQKDLQGTMLMDVVFHTFLPCCALVQEAQEIGWTMPGGLGDGGQNQNQGNTKRDEEIARQ